ncbi:hypothetical protein CG018_07595 [Gemella sp. ND 6198]|uniref:hypothetical protein n=1 Tax=Gemella sp. ND 6198 TaxID=2040624 RepID=UPI000E0C12CA|nr:hypothetical protein [Gemella sp. ND 6198]AXI27275.1 hypothetical protein CG018_07595 [Gemella sp. ND 6198]
MDELMKKITEKLSVSVDKIPELYTTLRTQYLIYEFFGVVGTVVEIATFLTFIVFVIMLIEHVTGGYDGKIFKLTWKILCSLVVVFILLVFLRFFLAPDVTFIKGVLN